MHAEADSVAPRLIPPDWQHNNIGFVRLALAVIVIFSHAFPLLQGNSHREPVDALFQGYTTMGRLAVAGFFAISGMLISESRIRRPVLQEFLLRRWLRIWPGFVAASFMMLLLFVPFGTDRQAAYVASLCSPSVDAGHILRAVFLKQPLSAFGFETNPVRGVIDGSLWTITYEFVWYGIVAVFGMLGLAAKRRPTLLLAAGTVLLCIADDISGGKLGVIQVGGIRLDNVLSCGAPFTMGMLALAYKDSIPRHPLILAAAVASFIPAHFYPKLLFVVVPTSYIYILYWFCFSAIPALARIGGTNDLSYGFYLYAYGVEQLLVFRLHWLRSPLLLFLLATAVTTPFALFSWFCIERPAKSLFKPSVLKP